MLARLARWLRVLGFDTTLDPSLHDRELVARAAAEDRVLLTRDRRLVEELRPACAVLVRSDVPLEQLQGVVSACGLTPPASLFSRCIVCNTPLHTATSAEAAALAPESARRFPDQIWRCPGCERVYWPGSHTRRMRAALARTLPEWFS